MTIVSRASGAFLSAAGTATRRYAWGIHHLTTDSIGLMANFGQIVIQSGQLFGHFFLAAKSCSISSGGPAWHPVQRTGNSIPFRPNHAPNALIAGYPYRTLRGHDPDAVFDLAGQHAAHGVEQLRLAMLMSGMFPVPGHRWDRQGVNGPWDAINILGRRQVGFRCARHGCCWVLKQRWAFG